LCFSRIFPAVSRIFRCPQLLSEGGPSGIRLQNRFSFI
jgi:hypothetical protein